MSARARRGLALSWTALFVLSLLLQYFTFATASGALAAGIGVDLDQWANQAPAGWQNGDLNGNNSTYHEGDVVPFRLAIEGLDAGTHTIHINHDFTAGGHKAYDFLATYNVTENATPCSAGGGAVSSLCPSLPAADTAQFGSDGRTINGKTVVGAYGATGRNLTMYGGTIAPIPAPVCSGSTDANSTCDYTITFTTTGSAAFFLWGGHLARSDYWNDPSDPDGAGQVSGAPWHMRTQNLDGSGNKNQDRSIQPSALVQLPALEITKVADAASVSAGDSIGFTVTITNTGTGAAGGLSFSDALPSGTGVSWGINPASSGWSITGSPPSQTLVYSPTSLAAGASASVHVVSSTTSASCKAYNNTASVQGTNIAAIQASASTTVVCATLAITKVADATSVNAGDPIGYTITLTNTGAGTAHGVKVSDTVPTNAGLSWAIDAAGTTGTWTLSGGILSFGGANGVDLASGASVHVHITSPTTSASCGTVNNSAAATSTNDGNPSVGPVAITVSCATLALTKVADAASVTAGSTIGYTITLTNTGAGTAHGVKVSDTVPTNAGLAWVIDAAGTTGTWTLSGGILSFGGASGVDLAAGTSVHVHITSPTTAATCGTVNNSAAASSTNDGNPSVGPVAITVNCPHLVITKTADAASVSAGDSIGFTVTIANTGAGAANGLSFSDVLPGGSGVNWSISPASAGWSISGSAPSQSLVYSPTSLAAGATTSVHVVSATTSASCNVYNNTASVTATNDAGGQASANLTVNCGALGLNKTADAASVTAGSPIGYTITLTNNGAGTVHGVKVSDTVPTNAGLAWAIDVAGTTGTWTLSGGILSFGGASGVDLASGASVHVHITSPTTAATCGTVNNSAAASSTSDGSPAVGPVAITVDCPTLVIAKAVSGNSGGIDPILGVPLAKIGDTLHYTLTYTGTGHPTNAVITDVLPVGLDYVVGSAAGDANFTFSGYDTATRTLTWNAATLPNPASGSVTYNVTVLTAAPEQPQPLTNTATIDSAQTAPDSDTAQVAVVAPPLAATGTPRITPPPTDAFTSGTAPSNPGFTLMLILLGLAGLAISIGFVTPTPERVRRRDRRG
jgi:uncharacterized repeat protein (TIGR01451 family)